MNIKQERELFEAEMIPSNQLIKFMVAFNRYSPTDEKNPMAISLSCDANLAWAAWQARAKLPSWISVEDELPELSNKSDHEPWSDPVLVVTDDGEQMTAIFFGDSWADGYDVVENITHWQPLPMNGE